jgi:hypothetical protein
MPRSKPFTSREIKGREKFGLGASKEWGRQAPAESIPYEGRRWDFSIALGELGITGKANCALATIELHQICQMYLLEAEVEKQETPARKAEALKKARHDHRSRRRAQEQLAKADALRARGKHVRARKTEAEARRMLSRPRLPIALEMEVSQRNVQLCIEAELRRMWALWFGAEKLPQESVGMDEALAVLEKKYRGQSAPGRHRSEALRLTVHRLQTFASGVQKRFAWANKRGCFEFAQPPPLGLTMFIHETLKAADIKHPNPRDYQRRSEFYALLLQPAPDR